MKEINDIKRGKWYMIDQYGFTKGVKGKAVDVCGNYVVLKFYWGNPFRTRHIVELNRLVGECNPPSWFSNY